MKFYQLQKEARRLILEAEVGTYASAAAFFLFLSIIPVIMLVSGLLPHGAIAHKDVVTISQAVVPERIYHFLIAIADSYHGDNVTLLSVSAVIVIWSASKGMLAMIRGLNHIYEIEESRNYMMLRLKAAFYTLFLLIAIVLSAGILVFGNTVADMLLPQGVFRSEFWKLIGGLRHILVACMISVVFCTMYCLLPNNQIAWWMHYPGAAFTSVFWTLYSFAFSIYIDYFDGFSMYGSLTTSVIVMIWLYFCMYIFFCGARVNRWIMDREVEVREW